MLHAKMLFVVAWLAAWHPPPVEPGRYGAFSNGAGWSYQLTKSDMVWF